MVKRSSPKCHLFKEGITRKKGICSNALEIRSQLQFWTDKLDDLHGRLMVNIISGATFYIYDKYSSALSKPSGWLSLKTIEDEINHILSPSRIPRPRALRRARVEGSAPAVATRKPRTYRLRTPRRCRLNSQKQ
jgi:hypothetical protein